MKRAAYLVAGLGFLSMILPIIIIVPVAFSSSPTLGYPLPGLSLRWFESILVYYPWAVAFQNSLIIACGSTLLATILGTAAAYGFGRATFPGKRVLSAIIIAPSIVPIVVFALSAYFMFAEIGLLGSLVAVILAHAVISLPIVFITVSAVVAGYDFQLVRAAYSLGAGPLKTFYSITLPLIAPGVLTGAVFAFMTSFDEIVIAVFLTGPGQITVPRQMFSNLRTSLDPSIVALAVIMTLFTVLLMVAVRILQNKATTDLGIRPP